MTIKLFDLADQSQRIFFSPYCWRIRMALKHKGLAFESLPWHFTEKTRIAASGGTRVPVIVDGATTMAESWEIALYLDRTYPGAPALMAGDTARARAKFIETWCRDALFAALRPIAVPAVFTIIAEQDKAYFRESRERMLGVPLEALSTDPAAETAAFAKALTPAADALAITPFLAGDRPDYSDIILFGTLMWPYMVCRDNPIDSQTAIGRWFARMLDLHDGYARRAPRAADSA